MRPTFDYDKTSIFSTQERRLLQSLSTLQKIQQYLDRIDYSDETRYHSPRTVLRESNAHCYDGAVFAAIINGVSISIP